MRRPIHSKRLIVIALLTAHAGLLAWGAWRHSPTVDEIAHLPAGISHWHFGRFDLYRVNPPLVRMIAALPVMAAGAETDWSEYTEGGTWRPELAVGQRFAEINGQRIYWYLTSARWACIPFSLVGAIVCYVWARQLYGPWPGMLALVLWCFCPTILGHAQLITPDAPGAAMGILAGYAFWHWLKKPTWGSALWAGVALGLCELTKTTWIVLFGLWPAIWIVWRGRQLSVVGCQLISRCVRRGTTSFSPEPAATEDSDDVSATTHPDDLSATVSRRAVAADSGLNEGGRHAGLLVQSVQLALILAIAVYAINFGYGFENTFQRLGEIPFGSRALGDHDWAWPPSEGFNRFRDTWMAQVRVPLPANYVRGIDLQRWDFERNEWSYLRGQWRQDGWWYYYLYALAVKVPLGTWGLLALALALGLFARGYAASWRDELCLLAPLVVVLVLVSSQTGMNHHMRYVLPIFPFAFVWMSKGARSFQFSVFSFQFGRVRRWLWAVSRPSHADRPKVSTKVSTSEAQETSGPSLGGVVRPAPNQGPARQAVPTRLDRMVAVIVVLCVIASVGSSLWVYPHSLSYFNELVGGPRYGYKHLDNSNIDWAQDLLYLKRWYDKHPEARPMGVELSWPLPSPKEAGIDGNDVPVGPNSNRAEQLPPHKIGPLPGWYAVSVNKLVDRDRGYAYFLELEPVGRAGYSIYIYHLTLDDANALRRQYGLPELPAEGREKGDSHL
jgi:hypothetical protein